MRSQRRILPSALHFVHMEVRCIYSWHGSKGKPLKEDPWKDWCWSWNSNTLVTWCEELTYWRSPWCWERLMARGEGDDRGWDGWMASLTRWTWVWASSRSWWQTKKPGVLQSMGSQRIRHDWAPELNWTGQPKRNGHISRNIPPAKTELRRNR